MAKKKNGDGKNGLSTKQKDFVRQYLKDLNATQAAIRAGYSENGAEVQGHRLLSNANIAAAIAKAVTERFEEAELEATDIIRLQSRLADSNMLDYVSWEGNVLAVCDSKDLTEAMGACISKVSMRKGQIIVELYDKQKALDKLGEYKKLGESDPDKGGDKALSDKFLLEIQRDDSPESE